MQDLFLAFFGPVQGERSSPARTASLGVTAMWPVIGGLASGIGSLLGGWMNSSAQQSTNQTNIGLQGAQDAFLHNESATAYQRASTDMQAAGLNPAMMFGSGSAAATPTIGPAHIDNPNPGQGMAGAGNAVNTMINNAISMKTMDKMTEEIANMKTVEAKNIADAAVSRAVVPRVEAETEQAGARTGNIRADTGIKHAIADITGNAAQSARNLSEFSSNHPVIRYAADVADWLGGKTSGALGPVHDLISSARGVNSMIPRRSTTETHRSFLPDGEMTFQERYGTP